MTAPKIQSDRPLWIVLLIDAAATAAAVLLAPNFFGAETRLDAAWSDTLAVNFVLWSAVAAVGVAGWAVDFIDGVISSGSGELEPVVPAVPDAMQEIIAASQHEHLVRGSSASLRLTSKSESRELETQNA